MAGPKPRREQAPESEAQVPQSTPAATGYPGRDFDYTLQCVIELQRSIGSMDAKIDGMKSSVDGLKGKVEDLVGWKHKILGGVAAIAFLFAALGFIVGKATDYVSIGLKPSPPATTQPPPPAPAPRKTP